MKRSFMFQWKNKPLNYCSKTLKPSLRREFVYQKTLGKELFSFNSNTVVVGEDFSIDDYLDFSNSGEQYHEEDEEEKDSLFSQLNYSFRMMTWQVLNGFPTQCFHINFELESMIFQDLGDCLNTLSFEFS
ncbi:hypothetical protein KIW84_041821 [Lathyrus oleraceus]|uniref:Uncharacterized protein n=1 Tax=Pisum sativum TaxID=3888 RepID=A0A9D4XDQ4_PEA|nr:hypothetical protein KIW84_041821 [Pisum sativum]